jgi:hypothetical protein
MTTTTRRAALTALAGASALAIPAVAMAASPTGDDAELIALAAEIQRLCAQGETATALGIEIRQVEDDITACKELRDIVVPNWGLNA